MKITLLPTLLFFVTLANAQITNLSEVYYEQDLDEPLDAIAISPDGQYAYIGGGTFGEGVLYTFDISDPQSITKINTINYPDFEVWDMLIDGNNLYVVGEDGLKIFDVSQPSSLSELTTITEVDGNDISGWAVEIIGNSLFVESGWSGLMSINISNPTQPTYNDIIGYSGIVKGLDKVTNSVIAAVDGYSLYLIDFSNPSDMTKTTISIPGDPDDVVVYESEGLIQVTSEGLSETRLYTVSISSESIVDTLVLGDGPITSSQLGEMSSTNDTLYIGTGNGFVRVDNSDLSNPTFIDEMQTQPLSGATDLIHCFENMIFAASHNDLHVYLKGGGVGIKEVLSGNSVFSVFPNPTTGNVNLNLTEEFKNATVSVFDPTGKRMSTKTLNDIGDFVTLHLGNKTGVYLLQCIMPDGSIKHAKVMNL